MDKRPRTSLVIHTHSSRQAGCICQLTWMAFLVTDHFMIGKSYHAYLKDTVYNIQLLIYIPQSVTIKKTRCVVKPIVSSIDYYLQMLHGAMVNRIYILLFMRLDHLYINGLMQGSRISNVIAMKSYSLAISQRCMVHVFFMNEKYHNLISGNMNTTGVVYTST